MEQGHRFLRKKQGEQSREEAFQQKQQLKARRPVLLSRLGRDPVSLCRVGDAVLGLVCMVLLLVLKLMRDHVPPVHPEMPPGVRLSHGLVWTATTGEGASWLRDHFHSSPAQPGVVLSPWEPESHPSRSSRFSLGGADVQPALRTLFSSSSSQMILCPRRRVATSRDFVCFVLPFLGLHPWHVEVPRLRV